MNLRLFKLEARSLELKVRRYYTLRIGKNLFNEWSLLAQWGRIQQGGQQKSFIFESQEELLKKTRQIIKKRLNAQSRIGCNYQITDYDLEKKLLPHFFEILAQA